MPAPNEFLEHIDKQVEHYIQRLSEAVAIPSVSIDAARRPDVIKMGKFLKAQLEAVDVEVREAQVPIGRQTLDGKELDYPPVLFGTVGHDTTKKTILVYGHYDVQPAEKSDGWNTDPFVLVADKEQGQLIGRGSTDDKGPVLAWINVLEAHKQLNITLPVNLRFVFEGMEESDSEGLKDLIEKEVAQGDFMKGVDAVCISDNYWLNTRTPCLTYGLRGICTYQITVKGPARDLHSGSFGRVVHEPMTDLVQLLAKLVDTKGNILIPGIDESVSALTDNERKRFEDLDFTSEDIAQAIGSRTALSDDRVKVLMGRMREPSLSLHGIEGAYSAPGIKTVIPSKVIGKFSIRIVPPQAPLQIDAAVFEYVTNEFSKLGSKNSMVVESMGGEPGWLADPDHWNFEAGRKATKAVYGVEPDYTREGGSIPVTLTFADALGVNVLLLPMGRGDDGAHSTNEKLDISNYIQGTKLLGAYLHEVGGI